MSKELNVCSCSAGIDSTTTMLYQIKAGYPVSAIHFDYGQLCELPERSRIKKICDILKVPLYVINLRWLGKLGKSPLTDKRMPLPKGFDSIFGLGCWVPARNVVFLAYAAALCESIGGGIVTLGGESSESHYLDNTQDFADRFTHMLELGCIKPVKLVMPLVNWTKMQELSWGYENGFEEIYKYTWSCDQGLKDSKRNYALCGECGCCNSRRYAYYKLGLKDPQTYLNDKYFSEVFLPEYEKRKNEVTIKYE